MLREGEVRYSYGSQARDYTFTGQRTRTDSFGLLYYNARWYDPQLGRFAQADSIVPRVESPMAWDRSAYVMNNPLRFIDPSGHFLAVRYTRIFGRL
jgi:RHS repeat-associated protein